MTEFEQSPAPAVKQKQYFTGRARTVYDAIRGGLRIPWIVTCLIITAIAIVLGISLGWRFRTKQMEDPGVDSKFGGRNLYVNMRLAAIDANLGTVTFDWSIDDDDCIDLALNNASRHIRDCPIVNIYFDQNLLAQNTNMLGSGDSSSSIPSNDRPDQAIFQYNASAYWLDDWSQLAVFRTVSNMYSNVTSLKSSTENYPFDRYSCEIFLYGFVNGTAESVGISIYNTDGVAAGFRALVLPQNHEDARLSREGVTNVDFVIYRTVLVRVYAVFIVLAMWLIDLVLMAITIKSVLFRRRTEPTVLVVPVATLFAFTQLRGAMPGAPTSFGTIIDFVGTLPTLAFLIVTAMFCLADFLFRDYNLGTPASPNGEGLHATGAVNSRPWSDAERGNAAEVTSLASTQSSAHNERPAA